jgi:hypothetical protein
MPDTMLQSPETAAPPQGAGTRLPVEIAQAIGAVMSKVRSLPKGERNEHGHYNFTSIDDFLAFVCPLCSASGLIVLQDEDSVDVFDRGGKGWLKIVYSFTLAHVSGVVSERPIRRTVLQPVTGPQTTGSSQSYALKQFMRSLFMIPTGDHEDADHQPQQDMPAAAPKARQTPQERAQGQPGPAPHPRRQTAPSGLLATLTAQT